MRENSSHMMQLSINPGKGVSNDQGRAKVANKKYYNVSCSFYWSACRNIINIYCC